MATSLLAEYHYVMNDLADPRVKDWYGFGNPVLPVVITGLYLLIVYVILPAYMEDRKPYSLKTVLYYYNIFQIAACTFLVYGMLTSGWLTTYSLGCQPVDYSDNPEAVRMLHLVYCLFILKGIELVETSMFILRKKYNQVSKLHVYHHSSTFILAWIAVKYVGGGMATFPVMVNSFIHILMYTYYLLASLGPEWQKRMSKWKPRLTVLQMIQFCVIIAHSLQALHPECKVQKELLVIYVPDILVVFYMFWDFYHESYMNKEKRD